MHCTYRYRLVPASAPSTDWRQRRTLAAFADVELGEFPADHRLARTWLALHRAQVEVAGQAAPGAPFGCSSSSRAPSSFRTGVRPELVKGLIDGVVSAFQGQVDDSAAEVVTARVAATLGADPTAVTRALRDTGRAVLGLRPQLVRPFRDGVKWDPSDHLCVVGRVLRRTGHQWRLTGHVAELQHLEWKGPERPVSGPGLKGRGIDSSG